MQCHELRTQLTRWNADVDGPEHFTVVIDDGEATFSKLDEGLLASVELTVPVTHEVALEDLLRLAHPSLSRFPGALARSPQDGRLWLLAQVPLDGHIDDLIEVLEALLNQRDTWQSMLNKNQRAVAAPVARRLSHAHLLGTGIRHA
ncbi:type III secretion system chaperone [Pseudomonas kilonensis]|uniref:Tir chaperone protein (CesT) family protein n=1 Tax=Pseudomonas kilonensis TaxID=132476 RepID=A0ABY0YV96_9PSED|nr:type III secretion system chaperone [Pseudomonas kilonensis]SED98624.1 Tir chaperone protein (CesT) family protein [Pseudomonas kilonensis]